MQCQTQKPGIECLFMKKAGCSYNGGKCYVIIESCEGCTRILEFSTGRFCSSFPSPAQKWQNANCFNGYARKEGPEGGGTEDQSSESLKKSRRKEVNSFIFLDLTLQVYYF